MAAAQCISSPHGRARSARPRRQEARGWGSKPAWRRCAPGGCAEGLHPLQRQVARMLGPCSKRSALGAECNRGGRDETLRDGAGPTTCSCTSRSESESGRTGFQCTTEGATTRRTGDSLRRQRETTKQLLRPPLGTDVRYLLGCCRRCSASSVCSTSTCTRARRGPPGLGPSPLRLRPRAGRLVERAPAGKSQVQYISLELYKRLVSITSSSTCRDPGPDTSRRESARNAKDLDTI